MERFAIKVNKSARKLSARKLCRLCGNDNPDKVPILDSTKKEPRFFLDGEPDLSKKIFDCVGIQVIKNDKMPQSVCQLCCDKINDFYEYREMCAATNIQTRRLLGLPEIAKALKASKRRKAEKLEELDREESIFGVLGDEIKIEDVSCSDPKVIKNDKRNVTKIGKKYRKKNRQSLIESIEKPANTMQKTKIVAPLLTLKAPNKREMMREKVQKSIEKKRKLPGKALGTAAVKKIKQEANLACGICSEDFPSTQLYNNHLIAKHTPNIYAYGCSSCSESFQKEDENKMHHDWHRMFNISYVCVICAQSFDRLLSFNRHVSACAIAPVSGILVDNISCDLCQLEFVTKNLFDWHDCFIKNNGMCPKCGRVFGKKTILFKHLFKCEGKTALRKSQIVVEIPGIGDLGPGLSETRRHMVAAVKAEPEAILDPGPAIADYDSDNNTGHFSETDDDRFMHSHVDDGFSDDTDTAEESAPSLDVKQSTQFLQEKKALISQCESRVLRVCLENIALQPDIAAKLKSSTSSTVGHRIDQIKKKNKNKKTKEDRLTRRAGTSESSVSSMVLPFRVKQEPIDYTTYTPVDEGGEQELCRINIKKEVLHSGYGDFDPDIARNIKQEKFETNPFKPPPLRLKIQKRHGSLNATIVNESQPTDLGRHLNEPDNSPSAFDVNQTYTKKLYKKPALLAIKIKQERVEREELNNGESSNIFESGIDEYVSPQIDGYLDSINDITTLASFDEEIQLPVIAEVSSVADVDTGEGSNMSNLFPSLQPSLPLAYEENKVGNATEDTLRTKNSYAPVRIKLEPPEQNYFIRDVFDDRRLDSMPTLNSIPIPQICHSSGKSLQVLPIDKAMFCAEKISGNINEQENIHSDIPEISINIPIIAEIQSENTIVEELKSYLPVEEYTVLDKSESQQVKQCDAIQPSEHMNDLEMRNQQHMNSMRNNLPEVNLFSELQILLTETNAEDKDFVGTETEYRENVGEDKLTETIQLNGRDEENLLSELEVLLTNTETELQEKIHPNKTSELVNIEESIDGNKFNSIENLTSTPDLGKQSQTIENKESDSAKLLDSRCDNIYDPTSCIAPLPEQKETGAENESL